MRVEVLRRVSRVSANIKVAILLRVNEETARVHMKHVLKKLHATDRTRAVTVALRRGIIEL